MPAGESSSCLEQSILHYQRASELEPESTDIAFNWAMALVTKGEHLIEPEAQCQVWFQALQMFESIEARQRQQMAEQTVNPEDFQQDDEQEDSSDEEVRTTGSEPREQHISGETFLVVPSTIAETVIASIGVLLSLVEVDTSSAPAYQQQIAGGLTRLQKLRDQASNDKEMRDNIFNTELDVRLSALQARYETSNMLDTGDDPTLLQDFEASFRKNTGELERLCEWADASFEIAFMLASARQPSAIDLCQKSFSLYEELVTALSSPISARSLAPQSIAPTLSGVHCSMALLHLLLSDVGSALDAAVKAVLTSQTGISFSPDKRFSKSTANSESIRDDLAATDALHYAAFVFSRVAFHAADIAAQEAGLRLCQNLKASRPQLQKFVHDVQGDALWSENEAMYWQTLFNGC